MTLRYTWYMLILTVAFMRCQDKTEKTTVVLSNVGDSIKLHALKKHVVVGDFDGDGKRDTIFQHTYSRLTRAEIDTSPDPFQNDWYVVVKWFLDRDPDVYLTLPKSSQDTLHLGPAQGLYCLINIGDINADRKDEVACVIDPLDFSRLNSCEIYSLCGNTWTLLKRFDIHEEAFDFVSGEAPSFDRIKDYLEKHDGEWVYRAYSGDDVDSPKETTDMRPLKLGSCK